MIVAPVVQSVLSSSFPVTELIHDANHMVLVDQAFAHELCHLRHLDHSPAYWRMLRSVMPDFERRRERLRVNGPRYDL